MLELEAITGGWGATTIVEDFSLRVRSGEAVTIIGRNGVGKSTLLELVMGRARVSAGQIVVGGKAVGPLPTYRRALAGLGYVPQEREVFPSLTVDEHLSVASCPGHWNAARAFELFPRLQERRGNLGSQLSGGEQQMLSIARALVGNPRVLLLDEPTEGLAPIVVLALTQAIGTIVNRGSIAVVIVEQNVEVAFRVAPRCIIMDRGRMVCDESSEHLCRDAGRLHALMGFASQSS